MKFKKMTAAALAAVLVTGTVSAVSFAEDTEVWTDENGKTWEGKFDVYENSKYEIIVENATVEGKRKVAVGLSNVPKEMLTYEYNYDRDYYEVEGDGGSSSRNLSWMAATIDVDDTSFFSFNSTTTDAKDFYCVDSGAWAVYSGDKGYRYRIGYLTGLEETLYYDGQPEISIPYTTEIIDNGDTIDLIAYVDENNENIKKLISRDITTVMTLSCTSTTKSPKGSVTGGFSKLYLNLTSDGDMLEGENNLRKERVKIINKLNETVDPGDTGSISIPDSSSNNSTNEPTILEATLNNVDSINGIEGEKLDAALFGDSGWTWEQVEKVEFSSDNLFSVQFSTDNGGWCKLGEEESVVRADDDEIWDTKWWLDTSAMAEDKKYAKVIAKDGTIDVNAKVYIKKDAVNPGASDKTSESTSNTESNSDNANTGIALAIAPVVLAAGAVIAVSAKKRK